MPAADSARQVRRTTKGEREIAVSCREHKGQTSCLLPCSSPPGNDSAAECETVMRYSTGHMARAGLYNEEGKAVVGGQSTGSEGEKDRCVSGRVMCGCC